MYGPSFTFLGIPACDLDDPATYKSADVIIVGAPIDRIDLVRNSVRKQFVGEITYLMMAHDLT
jgi:hypothetical protein